MRQEHLVSEVVRSLVVKVPQVGAGAGRLGVVQLPRVHLSSVRPPDAEERVVRRLSSRLRSEWPRPQLPGSAFPIDP